MSPIGTLLSPRNGDWRNRIDSPEFMTRLLPSRSRRSEKKHNTKRQTSTVLATWSTSQCGCVVIVVFNSDVLRRRIGRRLGIETVSFLNIYGHRLRGRQVCEMWVAEPISLQFRCSSQEYDSNSVKTIKRIYTCALLHFTELAQCKGSVTRSSLAAAPSICRLPKLPTFLAKKHTETQCGGTHALY